MACKYWVISLELLADLGNVVSQHGQVLELGEMTRQDLFPTAQIYVLRCR